MYLPARHVRVTTGTALGAIHLPYFDRTPRHFSGHVNAPSRPDPTPFPAAVECGPILWAAHPIFTCYYTAGAVAMLEMAERLIHRALDQQPMIRTSLPRAGRATVRQSHARGSDIVHLLHATPALRGTLGGQPIQPIQDLVTLHGINVSFAPRGKVTGITVVPGSEPLAFRQHSQRVEFTVPELRGHQMVEVVYENP
jgi:hypothetical protein